MTSYNIIVTNEEQFEFIELDNQYDNIILLKDSFAKPTKKLLNLENTKHLILEFDKINPTSLFFVSKKDNFNYSLLKEEANDIFAELRFQNLLLIINYRKPPVYSHRDDGSIKSFVVNYIDFKKLKKQYNLIDFESYVYLLFNHQLNNNYEEKFKLFQVGRNRSLNKNTSTSYIGEIDNSLIVIPHKGPSSFLNRCLLHLKKIKEIPTLINICFDDNSHKTIDTTCFKNPACQFMLFRNKPYGVGPYLPRHYSIINSNKEYIFFQDSDDISINERFTKQIKELKKRDLDMVGSHEIRVDQLLKKIIILRFPLDANFSLTAHQYHALFHPTALITKSAYLKTGGFSTDRKFGYDSQFLLRSYFFLKIGNIDDFLYIRFKRPNSLTTHPKTKIGSNLRSFLLWRWNLDFKLITEKKIKLEGSSIDVKKHSFKYNFIKL